MPATSTSLFSDAFKEELKGWLGGQTGITDKIVKEMYYQVVDVTRDAMILAGVGWEQLPLDRQSFRAFLDAHGDKFIDMVGQYRSEGRSVPVMDHLKLWMDAPALATLTSAPGTQTTGRSEASQVHSHQQQRQQQQPTFHCTQPSQQQQQQQPELPPPKQEQQHTASTAPPSQPKPEPPQVPRQEPPMIGLGVATQSQDIRQEFMAWLMEQKRVDDLRTAVQVDGLLVEFMRALLAKKGLQRDIDNMPMTKDELQELVRSNQGLVMQVIEDRAKSRKNVAFFAHVKCFLGVSGLTLPNWSDKKILSNKLREDYTSWIIAGRCVTENTVQQYLREISRMLKTILLEHRELGGPPDGGLTRDHILLLLNEHAEKVKTAESTNRKQRGWMTFKEFFGKGERDGTKLRKVLEWVDGKPIKALILSAQLQEAYVAWLSRSFPGINGFAKRRHLELAHKITSRVFKIAARNHMAAMGITLSPSNSTTATTIPSTSPTPHLTPDTIPLVPVTLLPLPPPPGSKPNGTVPVAIMVNPDHAAQAMSISPKQGNEGTANGKPELLSNIKPAMLDQVRLTKDDCVRLINANPSTVARHERAYPQSKTLWRTFTDFLYERQPLPSLHMGEVGSMCAEKVEDLESDLEIEDDDDDTHVDSVSDLDTQTPRPPSSTIAAAHPRAQSSTGGPTSTAAAAEPTPSYPPARHVLLNNDRSQPSTSTGVKRKTVTIPFSASSPHDTPTIPAPLSITTSTSDPTQQPTKRRAVTSPTFPILPLPTQPNRVPPPPALRTTSSTSMSRPRPQTFEQFKAELEDLEARHKDLKLRYDAMAHELALAKAQKEEIQRLALAREQDLQRQIYELSAKAVRVQLPSSACGGRALL